MHLRSHQYPFNPLWQFSEPTFPVNGTIWCSQRLNTSISFTMTNSLCPSWKIASFTISRTFSWYPFVKNNIAFAYLFGVPRSPSRSGSSPRHSRIVRTAPESFSRRAAACSGVSSFRSRVPRPAKYQTSFSGGRLAPTRSAQAVEVNHRAR